MELGLPLVSVVVPIYNTEAYLEECVDSLINQTYQSLEILLIDDGSTDKSPMICDNYAKQDDRVFVFHKENGGLGQTRNYGIERASGKYILFLDSDDYLKLNSIELLVKRAEKNKTDIILFSAKPFFDGISEGQVYTPKYIHSIGIYNVTDGLSSYEQTAMAEEYYTSSCLRFYRLAYLRNNNYKFEEQVIHEDEAFSFLSYVNAQRVELIPNRLYFRRYRAGSIMVSNSLEKSIAGYSAAIKRVMDSYRMRFQEMSKFEQEQYARQIQLYFSLIIQKYERMSNKDNKMILWLKTARILQDNCLEVRREIKPVAVYFSKNYKMFVDNMFVTYILIKGKRWIKAIVNIAKRIIRKLYTISLGRLLIGLKEYRKLNDIIRTIQEAEKNNANTVYLVMTPEHANYGDHAITYAEQELFHELNISSCEISGKTLFFLLKKRRLDVLNRKKIVVNGGGYLGSVWYHDEVVIRELLSVCPGSKFFFMPNTVFYEDTEFGRNEFKRAYEYYRKDSIFKIYAREMISYDVFSSFISRVGLAPDIVMSLNLSEKYKDVDRKYCFLCLRKDMERSIEEDDLDIIMAYAHNIFDKNILVDDMIADHDITSESRTSELEYKFNQFGHAQLVITDRLHAMIFAAVTGTPCIVLDSKSPKIRGCYQWLSHLGYVRMCDNIADLPFVIGELSSGHGNYNNAIHSSKFKELASDLQAFAEINII